jgi:hypothetical protein
MRKDQERMFGMSEEDIREQYMDGLTAKLSGLEMVVAGLLSDTQELMVMGGNEKNPLLDQARKNLNIAKFILFEMMDQKERV